jgi:phosphoribosylanthranilate isomerase
VTKIKICGLFREEDIDYANEAGPDYIGFVFAESRRRVTPALAERLRKRLSDGIIPVGVFVNAPPEEAVSLCRGGLISAIQLHGGEDGGYIRGIKERCSAPVIKALRMDRAYDPRQVPGEGGFFPDYLLLDHGKGGTGLRFDWGILEGNRPGIPFFLAGGINAATIEEALACRPFCIDVSSGVETNFVKDRDKMIELVKKVRNAV